MATAATIISRAMRLLGVLDSGAAPTAEEYADGLVALNALIDEWNNDRLMIYAIKDETLTLTPGDGEYTIGSGANINTTRPVSVESAFIRVAGLDYHINIIGQRQYDSIVQKSSQSNIPEYLYYKPGMASGTLYLYPVPSEANVLHVQLRTPFTAFSLTSTAVTLPPGYEQALASNLAITFAPEFQAEPSAAVVKMARESLAGIKRVNSRPILADSGLGAMFGRSRSNIITDEA